MTKMWKYLKHPVGRKTKEDRRAIENLKLNMFQYESKMLRLMNCVEKLAQAQRNDVYTYRKLQDSDSTISIAQNAENELRYIVDALKGYFLPFLICNEKLFKVESVWEFLIKDFEKIPFMRGSSFIMMVLEWRTFKHACNRFYGHQNKTITNKSLRRSI